MNNIHVFEKLRFSSQRLRFSSQRVQKCKKFCTDHVGVGDFQNLINALVVKARVINIEPFRVYNSGKCFSMILLDNTVVTECSSEIDTKIPMLQYNFVDFTTITTLPKDTIMDVFGKIVRIGDIEFIKTKINVSKREIEISDDSNNTISLVFWNEKAKVIKYKIDDTIIVKNGKVYEFNNTKFISVIASSIIKINCENVPEVKNYESYKLNILKALTEN
ncbi:hypothetical protein TSAR_015486 [Trichomalopsis sarcophagae]|uniref:Replication protein A OB domain-containing protein n=1 Tax=Trichomalopsis sarcophagae TaxID=543379 RepID=A0A232EGV7_9HYME|nr:hypothetical protein TSAR_015486 [Trichomalopsis sarcophagae]